MRRLLALALVTSVAACGGDDSGGSPAPTPTPSPSPSPTPSPTPTPTPTPIGSVTSATVATFVAPWAMTFLPDGRMLVTEKAGSLHLVTQAGAKTALGGTPAVMNFGQGGLQDVAIDPNFATNRRVYLSYAEGGSGGTGLALARGTLNNAGTALEGVTVIWRQAPKLSGDAHFGGRIAFSPDGQFLFVTAGERQRGAPAQDLAQTLGKVVRLNLDGTIPASNPFAGRSDARSEVWSYGHRNPYGLAFDGAGRLWANEMGPLGGDELNVIEAGANYGWPRASNGQNYDGSDIPDHRAGDGYAAPAVSWTPVISPSSMIVYSGSLFAAWRGDAIIGGLSSQGLVRVRLAGATASEAQRIALGNRIREVEQGPDGAIWVLEDGQIGRLRKLTPG